MVFKYLWKISYDSNVHTEDVKDLINDILQEFAKVESTTCYQDYCYFTLTSNKNIGGPPQSLIQDIIKNKAALYYKMEIEIENA